MPSPSNLPPVSQYGAWVAPLAVILRRLEKAMQPGGILDRMKSGAYVGGKASVRTSPLWSPNLAEAHTDKTLPCVRVVGLTSEGRAPRFAGARASGSPAANVDTPQQANHQLAIAVLSSVEHGLVQPEGGEWTQHMPGHFDWLAAVMDAIETDDSDLGDSTLTQTSTVPLSFTVTPAEVSSDMYYESVITVVSVTKSLHRAQRLCRVGT